jgi:hypothetical protein
MYVATAMKAKQVRMLTSLFDARSAIASLPVSRAMNR